MHRKPLRKDHSRFDLISPTAMVVLAIIGIFFIYSAQYYDRRISWLLQLAFLALGLVSYAVVSLTDYKVLLRYSHLIYIAAIAMLALVIWSPLGVAISGATRWLNIGFYKFQPVEIAKLACIATGASILTRSELGSVRDSFQVLAKMALAISIPFYLINKQPDLGSSLVLPPIVFAQLYASNLSKSFFTMAFAIFAFLVGLVVIDAFKYNDYRIARAESAAGETVERPHFWIPMDDYQKDRVRGYLFPDQVNQQSTGWQREQSVISVASGGAFGKGWLKGYQAQLGYLPRGAAHNDFIFSVIAEETGFLGSVIVLSLFGLLIGNSIRIASIARDRFGTLLALGVATLLSVHTFVNIAMTIGMMPITGLPLPFLSHGGTFLVSCCILMGITQSVYRFRKDF